MALSIAVDVVESQEGSISLRASRAGTAPPVRIDHLVAYATTYQGLRISSRLAVSFGVVPVLLIGITAMAPSGRQLRTIRMAPGHADNEVPIALAFLVTGPAEAASRMLPILVVTLRDTRHLTSSRFWL
jgi:hypothetical protein